MATPTTKKRTRTRKAIPRPPAKTRVAAKPPPITDPEGMDTLGNALVTAAENNPTMFVNPPIIPALKVAVGALGPAIVAAQGGTDAAQVTLLGATTKVHDLIMQHAAWIQGGANALAPADAATFITTAGFRVAKQAQRQPRSSPELKNGTPGVVQFLLPALARAIMWFTEISTDGGKTFARSVDTERMKGEITGLPSGQSLTVRLRAYLRGTGYTPWTTLTIVVT